ncbi:hypothetical protein RZN05_20040 [Sphingomonas sp. HF-S4]|uniref:CNP1-like uncharacterized domain-containing protein n=1 Tax=Sphingomonas agrestis TaxID=3080540 RepID=A0ABU3YD23_9SPHN|nr:hypothetical protein [Sphingomonas sp. HF-S4]MDV3459295.1 hypothetical protein [Sphingomonas sp. HF-S4]
MVIALLGATRLFFALGIGAMLLPAIQAESGSPGVYTPSPGSAERTAIVKTLHAGDDSPQSRFTFRKFHVLRTGPRSIAYVQGEGPVGAFQAILERDGKTPWRKVWGESDGGSNSCETGAQHYVWALRRIRAYTPAPDAVFPGIVARTRELQRMAKADPELQCVGDLERSPE